MLFPIASAEFWKQIRTTIEEVVNEKLNQQIASPSVSLLPERPLLKVSEVCAIFQVSKPTLYDWLSTREKYLRDLILKLFSFFCF